MASAGEYSTKTDKRGERARALAEKKTEGRSHAAKQAPSETEEDNDIDLFAEQGDPHGAASAVGKSEQPPVGEIRKAATPPKRRTGTDADTSSSSAPPSRTRKEGARAPAASQVGKLGHFALLLRFSDASKAPSAEQLRDKANDLSNATSEELSCHVDVIGSTLYCRGFVPDAATLQSTARIIAGIFPPAQFSALAPLTVESDETDLQIEAFTDVRQRRTPQKQEDAETRREASVRRLTGRNAEVILDVSRSGVSPLAVPRWWPQVKSLDDLDTGDVVLFSGESDEVRSVLTSRATSAHSPRWHRTSGPANCN